MKLSQSKKKADISFVSVQGNFFSVTGWARFIIQYKWQWTNAWWKCWQWKMPNENGYDKIMRVTNDDEEGIDESVSADEN